jgi:von Willebrand factor type A domain
MPTPLLLLRRSVPHLIWVVTTALTLLSACDSVVNNPFIASAHARKSTPPQESSHWSGVWSGNESPPDLGPVAFSAPTAEHCRRWPSVREVAGDAASSANEAERWRGEDKRSMLSRRNALPAAAPTASGKAASRAMESAALADHAAPSAAAPSSPTPQVQAVPPRPAHEVVTAGTVDDNADFGEYRAYRERSLLSGRLLARDRDVSERQLLEVLDAAGRPVHDAEVVIQRAAQPQPVMWARTDTAGRVWLHPRVFLPADAASETRFGVAVRKGHSIARTVWSRGQSAALQVRLKEVQTVQRPRLDLVFLVDATGSMADEIAKLKTSMRAVAAQIAQLPTTPDVCYGLVTYRDRGDAYLTRSHDFTHDLGSFQSALAQAQAAGGGDTPEALNEALHETVHGLSWRREAVRLVVLVADAPPHLDYCATPATQHAVCPLYDRDMQAALAKGIKLFAVGASGLDSSGEFIFRQMAQYTAGRFVFLTYKNAWQPSSGPGGETAHDVTQYSVQTLDKLIVRLVADELAQWANALKPGST